MSDWTIDRILLEPKRALAELQEAEKLRIQGNKRINDLLVANNRYLQDGRNWRIVEELRAPEGNCVTLVCDNPDFNGQPNAKVICVGDWTEWEELTFTGDTMDHVLGKALVAYQKFQRSRG